MKVCRASLYLPLILLLAICVRLYGINRGFEEDEIYSYLYGASMPFWKCVTHQEYCLYDILSYFTLGLSDSEWALRLPSLICGVLGVWALYRFAARVVGMGVGLVAALMLATSELHVWHSGEARFYACMMLGGVLALDYLDRALRAGRVRDWLFFVLAANFTVLSQMISLPYVFGLCFGAVVVILVTTTAPTVKVRRMLLVAVCGVAGISTLVGSYALGFVERGGMARVHRILTSADSEHAAAPADTTDGDTDGATGYVYPKMQKGLTPGYYLRCWLQFFPELPVVYRILLYGFIIWGFISLRRVNPPVGVLVAAGVLIPPLALMMMPSSMPIFARYLSNTLPIAVLCGALGLSEAHAYCSSRIDLRPGTRAARIAAFVYVVLFAVWVSPLVTQLRGIGILNHIHGGLVHSYIDWKGAAGYIRDHAEPTDLAIPLMQNGPGRIETMFYLQRLVYPKLTALPGAGSDVSIWYVTYEGFPMQPSQLPQGADAEHVLQDVDFSGVEVYKTMIHIERNAHRVVTPFYDASGGSDWDLYCDTPDKVTMRTAGYDESGKAVLDMPVYGADGSLYGPMMSVIPGSLVYTRTCVTPGTRWGGVHMNYYGEEEKILAGFFQQTDQGLTTRPDPYHAVRFVSWAPDGAYRMQMALRLVSGAPTGTSCAYDLPEVYVATPSQSGRTETAIPVPDFAVSDQGGGPWQTVIFEGKCSVQLEGTVDEPNSQVAYIRVMQAGSSAGVYSPSLPISAGRNLRVTTWVTGAVCWMGLNIEFRAEDMSLSSHYENLQPALEMPDAAGWSRCEIGAEIPEHADSIRLGLRLAGQPEAPSIIAFTKLEVIVHE